MASEEFLERVKALVSRITYKGHVNYTGSRDWEMVADVDQKDPEGRVYLQVHHWRPDVVNKKMGWGKGGKAYLSEHMTDSEIYRRAFSLFMAYEEHECREWFKIDGKAVFGPHIDVLALMEVADKLDVR